MTAERVERRLTAIVAAVFIEPCLPTLDQADPVACASSWIMRGIGRGGRRGGPPVSDPLLLSMHKQSVNALSLEPARSFMAENLRFDPLFPAHAIERCAVTIAFKQPLPERAFERAVGHAASEFNRKGLQASPVSGLAIGINVDLSTGKIGPVTGPAPRSFTFPDRSASLLVAPNAIAWQNTRYVRWAPFIGQLEGLVSPVLLEFLEASPPSSIRLEYWDRFMWSGDWTNFDVFELLRRDSTAIAMFPAKHAQKEWHSHSGWFEAADNLRRLVNVNVDVTEIVGGKPSVLIYTMMQDEPNVPGYGVFDPNDLDAPFVFSRLEVIHRVLKTQLSGIINDAMVERIGLLEGEK